MTPEQRRKELIERLGERFTPGLRLHRTAEGFAEPLTRAELREALEYVHDACGRALRLAENDRGSDRMAYQVVREMEAVLARAVASERTRR